MSILGIDIGTTGTKSIAFDHYGEILSSHYIEYNTIFIKDGWIELDPKIVMDSVISALKIVSKEVAALDPVEVIGISCLGCVVIPVDSKDNYLYNGMTFMDSRSVDDFENKLGMDKYDLYKITGKLQCFYEYENLKDLTGGNLTVKNFKPSSPIFIIQPFWL